MEERKSKKEQSYCTIGTVRSTSSKVCLESCNLDEFVGDDVPFAIGAVSSTRRIDLRVVKKSDERLVPKSCAICLMDYDGPERICYSSNPNCVHVFHQNCIFNWMVSLGKSNTMSPLILHRCFRDEDLLRYPLRCPCCRNDFHIVKELKG